MSAAPTPWWTRPFRIMRRDYISEYDRLLAQDPAELARETKGQDERQLRLFDAPSRRNALQNGKR